MTVDPARLDALARASRSGMTMGGLRRRSFLRGASLTSLALASPGLLAACGTEGAQVDADECKSTDLSDEEKTIIFSNWVGYIDPVKAKDTSTLEKFEAETGITVDYKNGDVNDNETFFAEVSRSSRSARARGATRSC